MFNNFFNNAYFMKYKIFRNTVFLLFFLVVSSVLFAQEGSTQTYKFLDISNAPRLSAIGSNIISVNDGDINLAYASPALISEEMSGQICLNYINNFANINNGFITYGQKFNKIGVFVASLHFINYGDFVETDYAGNEIGNFNASEYALTIGWAKRLSPRFNIGVNLKNIFSSLYTYNSYGIGADVALNYYYKPQLFSASLVMANMGRQVTTYNGTSEDLPFEAKLALSKKLNHAPFRLHLVYSNIQKWDLTYSDPDAEPETDPFTGEVLEEKGWDFGDKLARHFVIGAEFVPGNGNFYLMLGYNYKRRQEMAIASRKSMVGISWGLGFKVKKFKLSYSRATFSLAGSTNTISITTNLNDFLK